MRFELSSQFGDLETFVPAFVDLCGSKFFEARVRQLRRDIDASPFLAKIVLDYHWMELCLSDLREQSSCSETGYLDDWCALKFAAMCVETHRRLTPLGQNELEGRLRDGLKSDAGFAPLYAEMDIALRFLAMGFDVEFEDLNGRAPFDLLASKGDEECEVECKSFSVDAGRKIHRRDFYRLAHALEEDLAAPRPDQREALVVTLKGRLSGSEAMHKEIATAIRAQFGKPDAAPDEHEQFCVVRIELAEFGSENELFADLRARFGENIHVAGGLTDTAGRLLIVCSAVEDDTSKPVLQHIRNAADQLSGTRSGFVALQFNDIGLSDLLPDHLLRRVGILSHAATHHYQKKHLTGVMVGSYRNAVGHGIDITEPTGRIVIDPKTFFQLGPHIRSILKPGEMLVAQEMDGDSQPQAFLKNK